MGENTSSDKPQPRINQLIDQPVSSEDLDQTLHVVNPQLWIAYSTLVIIVLIILAWILFGSIPIKIEGKGIFVARHGFFTIQAKVPGVVQELKIKPGGYVKKGDFIAEVFEPQDRLKLELAEVKVQTLYADLERLKNIIEGEREKEKKAVLADIDSHLFNIKRYQREIESIQKELKIRQKLLDQGLIASNTVRETEKELSQREITIEKLKAELQSLDSNLHKSYRTEEYRKKEEDFLGATQERDLLQMAKNYARIYSPHDGYVVEILNNEDERVSSGDPLVLLEYISEEENLQTNQRIYGFVPVDLGKRIKLGTEIQIEVSTVIKEEYGFMLGYVREISAFPLSPERMKKIIPNHDLITYLMGTHKAVMQLMIEPALNPDTFSGYQWTSKEGPPMHITSGTVCSISAIVERIRPFYYVFPFSSWRLTLYNEK